MEPIPVRERRIRALPDDKWDVEPEEWTLPIYTSRPLCSTGDLCIICDENLPHMLDFTKLIDQEPELDFGWLDCISATKSCALCQFIAEMAEHTGDLDLGSYHAYNRVHCTIVPGSVGEGPPRALRTQWTFLLELHSLEEAVSDKGGISVWIQSQDPVLASFALDQKSLLDLRKYDAGLSDDTIESFDFGRKIADDVHPTFLKTCYDICQQHYGSKCQILDAWTQFSGGREMTTQPSLRYLRVIDTELLKLVYLPDGADFVALSYTWSAVPCIALLETTEERLFGTIELEKLPHTIRDSIQVVRYIGERYLWADRLCIMQDSPKDKATQLAQMDRIYLQATLTIVAAASGADGVDKGLPGVRKGTRSVRQPTATIRQHVQFTHVIADRVDAHVKQSHWATRAWTYQEQIMSRRQLVFFQQQVAFVCQQETFTEDHISGDYLLDPTGQVAAARQNDGALATDRTTIDTSYHHDGVVGDYTQRRMSDCTDVLNAINGLLRIITKANGEKFLCGLPMSRLVTDWLVWRPTGYSERRCSMDLPFLPSWTWAGWIGHVVYDPEIHGECEELVEGEYAVIVPAVQKGEERNEEAGPPDLIELRPAEVDDDIDLLFHHSCLQRARLRFFAPTATAHLAPTLWGFPYRILCSDLPETVSRAHQVFLNSSFAGLIFPHIPASTSVSDLLSQVLDFRRTLDYQRGEQLREIELVALSEAPRPWAIFYPCHPDHEDASENYFYLDEEGEKQSHVPFDPEVWNGVEEGGRVVNVLMIEWDHIEGCMVARRTGVGQVHRDAWEMAGPKVREIVLG
ncbi:hypothetical protein CKM354_000774700 [Cercospora kikuchii]|uniref:Heterokaryon incompatibility domain-containing protein n=1 Tax=Cercospora kikuchii TaxID=84275 RepID=A0A9P3FHR5_9PEZI|nr:uncharacterized protein CKM354_000774700 [Cercospora kikuchii]GIZ44552.1 hypothetical protein CKM354_000774700 [Cercospora kikuchii]